LKLCQKLQNLRVLRLSGDKFEGTGLREHRLLQKLGLGGKGFTDQALKEVKELKNLRYLSLLHTSITEAGLKELEQLANLEHLTLFGNKTTKDSAPRLHQALPKLDVQTFSTSFEF